MPEEEAVAPQARRPERLRPRPVPRHPRGPGPPPSGAARPARAGGAPQGGAAPPGRGDESAGAERLPQDARGAARGHHAPPAERRAGPAAAHHPQPVQQGALRPAARTTFVRDEVQQERKLDAGHGRGAWPLMAGGSLERALALDVERAGRPAQGVIERFEALTGADAADGARASPRGTAAAREEAEAGARPPHRVDAGRGGGAGGRREPANRDLRAARARGGRRHRRGRAAPPVPAARATRRWPSASATPRRGCSSSGCCIEMMESR